MTQPSEQENVGIEALWLLRKHFRRRIARREGNPLEELWFELIWRGATKELQALGIKVSFVPPRRKKLP